MTIRDTECRTFENSSMWISTATTAAAVIEIVAYTHITIAAMATATAAIYCDD